MINKLILILLLVVFASCNNQDNTTADMPISIERNILKSNLSFPDNISPIYYLDTIQIESPIVIMVDSIQYITSRKIFDEYCDSISITSRNDVIRYVNSDWVNYQTLDCLDVYDDHNPFSFSRIASRNDYTIEFNTKLEKEINGIFVYQFCENPKFFFLVLVANISSIRKSDCEHGEDSCTEQIADVTYGKDYKLGLIPVCHIEAVDIDFF